MKTELRCGNWVNCSIYNGNKDVNIQFEFQEYKYIHLFKPIPLTEEILLKCGFEKLGEEESDIFFRLYLGFKFGNHFFITGNIENGGFYCHGDKNLKYLHQLQNLFFAVGGSELSINPLTK